MGKRKYIKRDFLIGMMPGESSLAGSESAEGGIGILDVVLEVDDSKGD